MSDLEGAPLDLNETPEQAVARMEREIEELEKEEPSELRDTKLRIERTALERLKKQLGQS